MSLPARIASRAAAAIATTAMIGTAGLVAATQSESSATYKVTSQIGLNVRSGPSQKNSVIGVIGRGATIKATGPTRSGWVPVSFSGRRGWVASRYVVATDGAPNDGRRVGTTGTARTTEALNARTGPGTNFSVHVILRKGVTVALTGRTSGPWRQIKYGAKLVWVHSQWLTGGTGADRPTDTVPISGKYDGFALAALNLRTSSASNHKVVGEVPKGTRLSLTGVIRNGYAEIVYRNKHYWVTARYVGTSNPKVPALPKVVGTKYATVALDIRSSATNSFTLAEVPAGTALPVTGVVHSGRAQVVYQNAIRWVTAKYLSVKAPAPSKDYSKGLEGLTAAAKSIVGTSRQRFPQITTYYGVRPDSLPDHPSGRAVDIMIPSPTSDGGRALGQSIANYFKANAYQFSIEYIIWDQHIWSVARSREGWRYMADRGGPTANHKDHVHITVKR